MQEYNFRMTVKEVDSLINALSFQTNSLVEKLQNQFAEQNTKQQEQTEDEILVEEENVYDSERN